MKKIDLDELKQAALAVLGRDPRSWDPSVNPAELVVMRQLLALIAHIRDLEGALGEALAEVEYHCEEYQHITPTFMRADWRSLIDRGPVLL